MVMWSTDARVLRLTPLIGPALVTRVSRFTTRRTRRAAGLHEERNKCVKYDEYVFFNIFNNLMTGLSRKNTPQLTAVLQFSSAEYSRNGMEGCSTITRFPPCDGQ
jgi:hypothetical protein